VNLDANGSESTDLLPVENRSRVGHFEWEHLQVLPGWIWLSRCSISADNALAVAARRRMSAYALSAGLVEVTASPTGGHQCISADESADGCRWSVRIQQGFPSTSGPSWASPTSPFVVGSHATLIVDTGLAPKNGATAARVAAKLAPNNPKLFLTTTHFHPEHAAGEPGFPPGTILIRNAVQQQEMKKHGQEMIDMFSQRSPQNKELLAGVVLRPTCFSTRRRRSILAVLQRACSGSEEPPLKATS